MPLRDGGGRQSIPARPSASVPSAPGTTPQPFLPGRSGRHRASDRPAHPTAPLVLAALTLAASIGLAASSSEAAADPGVRTETAADPGVRVGALGATSGLSPDFSPALAGAAGAGQSAAAPLARSAVVANAVAGTLNGGFSQGSPAAARQLPQAASRAAQTTAVGNIRTGLAAARVSAAQAATRAAAASAARAKTWAAPMSSRKVNSGFGSRWGRLHAGLDIDCETGAPVRAMSGGTVTFAGVQGGYGNKVEVTFWDGTLAYFGHLSSIDVSEGDKVTRGDLLGKCGSTGRSTGPHLHLEIRPRGAKDPVDPAPWLRDHGMI